MGECSGASCYGRRGDLAASGDDFEPWCDMLKHIRPIVTTS